MKITEYLNKIKVTVQITDVSIKKILILKLK